MKPVEPITVLLVDDQQRVREGLRKILEYKDDIEIVGEAATGREAVTMAMKLCPAVVVMDVAMPLLNGMDATRQILDAMPETKVLILSAHSDDAYVEKAMALGAVGFLLKQTFAYVLYDAIREIGKGHTYFSTTIEKQLLRQQELDRNGQQHETGIHLTPREMEVLQQIAEGEANMEIAADLEISIKAVKKHRSHLMQKLDIHDTAGLVRYAIATGIIESTVNLTILL